MQISSAQSSRGQRYGLCWRLAYIWHSGTSSAPPVFKAQQNRHGALTYYRSARRSQFGSVVGHKVQWSSNYKGLHPGPITIPVSLHAGLYAPVLFRKMTLKVASVMKDAGHLDYAIGAAAIHQEMSRLFHAWAFYSGPAALQVIRAGTFNHYLGTCC